MVWHNQLKNNGERLGETCGIYLEEKTQAFLLTKKYTGLLPLSVSTFEVHSQLMNIEVRYCTAMCLLMQFYISALVSSDCTKIFNSLFFGRRCLTLF
jgi:hypothetical protein